MGDIDVKELFEVVKELQKNQEMMQRRDALHAANDPREELKKLGTRVDAMETRVDALEKAAKKK